MVKLFKKISKKTGLPPGAFVHIGEKKIARPEITVLNYSTHKFEEKKISDITDLSEYKNSKNITWINIDGIHEVELLDKVSSIYDIHPLVIEDILNTDHRPKIDDMGDYLFVISKMLLFDSEKNIMISEQVSLIIGSNYVISFQEAQGDVLNPLRERIRNGKGKIRKMGSDFLGYAILDSIVDNYFLILEKIGEKIETLDEELIKDPAPDSLEIIQKLKRDLLILKRSIWPLREVINTIKKGESVLIKKNTLLYFGDLYDHNVQIIDTVETFRDMLSGLLDIYMTSVSNKMNIVMKVLTIIATIFIPLTFIAGIYGMNFKFMPELEWRFGYFLILAVMLVLGILMLFFFKKKKWI